MKLSIDVKDKAEAENLRRALERPDVRAFVVIVGALLPLSHRARTRVLTYLADKVDEDAARLTIETTGDLHDLELMTPTRATKGADDGV